ncbi:MAG: YvcK family protein [Candidatus Moranbacteria bacterium]|nr:YvcK family protein [Candidatus Moranbacteria bacterium]
MKRQRIVTIGGGTGSFVLLSGLRKYPVDLTAVVSMADDGGSTGVLRDELGVLPPGDVRQCLVALSDSSDVLRNLMNYRFDSGGLDGHNFGNLFLSALEKTTGSMSCAVREAAEILHVRGVVLPVTEGDMRLRVHLRDGSFVDGESHLDDNVNVRCVGISDVSLLHPVKTTDSVCGAIQDADVIVIGPGDLYGSIVPNLLVEGVSSAIRSSSALVVYVCSLTNKRGITDGFDVDDYVSVINHFLDASRVGRVLVNSENIPEELVRRYESMEGSDTVVFFRENRLSRRSYRVVLDGLIGSFPRDVMSDVSSISGKRSFIRHDPDLLAQAIVNLSSLD